MVIRNLAAVVLMAGFVLSACAQSYQSAETTDYIGRYHKTAIREMYLYNVPASITLAQGILESGSGRSLLATQANNHFGIKCGDYSGKKFYKDDDKRNECFRSYAHADESFRDHSLFLSKQRYADLFKLKATDYKGWAKGLKKAGYATNPKYPQLLTDIIEQNKLYEYDRNPEKYLARRDADRYSLDDNSLANKRSQKKSVPEVENGRINGVKCVLVKSGDTFYSLAKQTGLSVKELKALNDFPDNHILRTGEYVFTEKKRKKNKSAAPHTVQRGETWLTISQTYGVRESSLRKMNRMRRDEPSVGSVVRLR